MKTINHAIFNNAVANLSTVLSNDGTTDNYDPVVVFFLMLRDAELKYANNEPMKGVVLMSLTTCFINGVASTDALNDLDSRLSEHCPETLKWARQNHSAPVKMMCDCVMSGVVMNAIKLWLDDENFDRSYIDDVVSATVNDIIRSPMIKSQELADGVCFVAESLELACKELVEYFFVADVTNLANL